MFRLSLKRKPRIYADKRRSEKLFLVCVILLAFRIPTFAQDPANELWRVRAEALEMDEFAVKEGLASITSVEMRAQLRLDLLQATLGRIKRPQ